MFPRFIAGPCSRAERPIFLSVPRKIRIAKGTFSCTSLNPSHARFIAACLEYRAAFLGGRVFILQHRDLWDWEFSRARKRPTDEFLIGFFFYCISLGFFGFSEFGVYTGAARSVNCSTPR